MKLVKPDIHPKKDSIVFALNSMGYLGVVQWNGENWICPDCSSTEQVEQIKSMPWLSRPFDKQQKSSIVKDIACWLDFSEQTVTFVDNEDTHVIRFKWNWKKFSDEQPPIGAQILVYGNPTGFEIPDRIFMATVVHVFGPQLCMHCGRGDAAYKPFSSFTHWILCPDAPEKE
jgi:hypothetical protein